MKIAFATNDMVTIAPHFGRARGFLVIELEEGKILREEFRENTPHPHHHAPGHRAQQILGVLQDCEVVVTRGMGTPAYQALREAGKQVIVTSVRDIREALERWQKGALTHDPQRVHSHHHHHGH